MRHTNGVPADNVGIGDRTIGRRPLRQPFRIESAVRIRAGGVSLALFVGSHPEDVARKARPLRDARSRVGQHRRDAMHRHDAIARRATDRVLLMRIADVPGPRQRVIGVALGVVLGLKKRRLRTEGVADRIVRTNRDRLGLNLAHRVVRAIDVEVEAEAEEVLMVRTRKASVDHARPLQHLAVRVRHRRDDAVELHFELDVAIEAKVPPKRVVVVADCRHRVDDEASRAPALNIARGMVGVLPEQTEILFVQTDRIRQLDDLTMAIREVRVEVRNVADAVAAQDERVRAGAEAVLAGVEVVAPVVHRVRSAVRDNQLGTRGAVHDATSLEAHVVQNQAFLRVE